MTNNPLSVSIHIKVTPFSQKHKPNKDVSYLHNSQKPLAQAHCKSTEAVQACCLQDQLKVVLCDVYFMIIYRSVVLFSTVASVPSLINHSVHMVVARPVA